MRLFALPSSFALLLFALLFCPRAAPGAAASDEALLKDNKVPTDGPGLLEYFKKRGGEAVPDAKLKELIEQLGDDDFFKREEASKKLTLAGPRASARLKEALKHPDLEVRRRASRCLDGMEREARAAVEVASAAVRLLAKAKPEGACAVLLDHLTRAEDPSVAEEVRHALKALAVRDGKADASLVAALRDKAALKRGAAALALCGVKGQRPAVRKLLDDKDDDVRLSVALALAHLGEKDAVPALISFMDRTPTRQLGAAEDVLFRLAGQKSPHLADGEPQTLKRYRRAWERWWKEAKEKADLGVLTEAEKEAAHTTVVLLDENQVIDLDASGKERWTIDRVQMVLDVQRLPGDRVLLAEYNGGRVTERDRKGEVLWEKKVAQPLMAQRLPNGNTFIASADGVTEVTRNGKEVFSYNPPVGQKIMRARKVPGGEVLLVLELGTSRFARLDRFGKTVKEFGVQVNTSGGRIDLTPAGHVLIPEVHNNRVQERDLDGKIIREIAVPQPITAFSLPNGHVLVTSMSQRRAFEIDRAGKEVWEYKRDTRVTRAVRHF